MAEYSSYQAFPGPAAAVVRPRPLPVLVAVAAPARQRRLTVAFRLLLAVPHLLVLALLGIAATVVAFLGWWGALFTGRLPRFTDTFLSGYVRWFTRAYAYLYLLTDEYPGFTFDSDPWYPVRTAIPDPQRLNRAAVFFRFILALPVAVLANLLTQGGGTLIAFVAWLITLITGRLPVSLHLAYAAVLRFQARLAAYSYMLTPAYPGGLFGDPPGAPGWTAGPQPAPEPYWGDPGYGDPAYAPQPVPQIPTWQLPLTRGAKRLLITFIVLGVISGLGINAYNAVTGRSRVEAVFGAIQLNRAADTLNTSINTWHQGAADCGQDLPCLTRQDAAVAAAYRTFAGQVSALSLPSDTVADKARLVSAANALAADFTELGRAKNSAEYNLIVDRVDLQQEIAALNQDAQALNNDIRAS